jgi:hypothetical protein
MTRIQTAAAILATALLAGCADKAEETAPAAPAPVVEAAPAPAAAAPVATETPAADAAAAPAATTATATPAATPAPAAK